MLYKKTKILEKSGLRGTHKEGNIAVWGTTKSFSVEFKIGGKVSLSHYCFHYLSVRCVKQTLGTQLLDTIITLSLSQIKN